jgi:hypothetical protein
MFKGHGFSDARDLMIILWVIMQGFGWFHPSSYGIFQAQVEQAYLEHADRLGYWTEE